MDAPFMCSLATLLSSPGQKSFKGFTAPRSITWNGDSFRIRDHSLFTRLDSESSFCDFEGGCSPGHSSMQKARVKWILSVRLSMPAFRSWRSSFIKPYWPSHFSHQFGYTQGRVGLLCSFFHGES